MPKKENNNKNWRSNEAFKAHQKVNRPKQVWHWIVPPVEGFDDAEDGGEPYGIWKHYDVPEDE